MVGLLKVIFLIKYKIKEFKGFKNLIGPGGPVMLYISRELIEKPEGKIKIELNKEKRYSLHSGRWKKMHFII